MTPPELLAAAREILSGAAAQGVAERSRIAALLARQALERRLIEFWNANPATAGLGRSSGRSQLTCLPAFLDAALAHEVSYAWAALSNACHYHSYDLSPTPAELTSLINTVARFLTATTPSS
jgi:hypothetical protein